VDAVTVALEGATGGASGLAVAAICFCSRAGCAAVTAAPEDATGEASGLAVPAICFCSTGGCAV
jgi:hypothetical protein